MYELFAQSRFQLTDIQPTPPPSGYCGSRIVAGNDLLLDALLPALSDGQAYWSVLYRCTSIGSRCWTRLCWISEDGWRPWLRWFPVDVPGVGCDNHRAWICPALVATGPPCHTR